MSNREDQDLDGALASVRGARSEIDNAIGFIRKCGIMGNLQAAALLDDMTSADIALSASEDVLTHLAAAMDVMDGKTSC